MNIEQVAQAIEADAGQALPDLRQALAEVEQIRAGKLDGCRITRPEQLMRHAARMSFDEIPEHNSHECV